MTWNPLLLAHIVNVKIPRLIPVSSKGSRHVYVMNACKRYQRSKIFYISKKILQPTQPVTWSKLCIPDLDEAPRSAASLRLYQKVSKKLRLRAIWRVAWLKSSRKNAFIQSHLKKLVKIKDETQPSRQKSANVPIKLAAMATNSWASLEKLWCEILSLSLETFSNCI